MRSRRYLHTLFITVSLVLLAGFFTLALANAQEGPTTTRVSVASDGTQGNSGSEDPAISADGRFVAFESEADNLVPGDTNDRVDIFVYDRQSGQTERVSIASDGIEGNNDSKKPAISADGRFVAFWSKSNNLAPGDTNGYEDVFVHDRQSGQTERVSIASDGTPGNSDSYWPAISADGRFVAFESEADNLVSGDTNPYQDIFVHDRQIGQTKRVSVVPDGIQGDIASHHPAISADGRFVAFELRSTDAWEVFVYDRQGGQIERVSIASDGTQGNSQSSWPALSADGRFVAFWSHADNLVLGDTNDDWDVFVHDRQSGQTERVSVASDGTQGTGDPYPYSRPTLSADGRFVAFESFANNLVPGDNYDAIRNIYVHDRQTGETSRISVASDDTQAGGAFPSISADGRFVVFKSMADNLVPGDTNYSYDIFVHDRYGNSGPPPDEIGSISGRVTRDADGLGLGGISVMAYSSGQTEVARTTTDSAGEYALTSLSPGDYRLHFVDPNDFYRREYYQNRSTFATADPVSVVAGVETSNIDGVLEVAASQAPDTEVEGDVSVGHPPNSDEVVIRASRTGSMTITQRVTCAGGVTPTDVTLLIDSKPFLPKTVLDDGRYQFRLTVPADLPNLQGPFDLSVRYQCDGVESTEAIGRLFLYDPSGQITDAGTGAAITGAVVNLYRVPDAQPDSGTAQDGDCRTVTSLANAGETWSDQPAADLAAGAWLNPDLLELDSTVGISPTINPQRTGSDGRYGWDVSTGCWYIAVSAEGYESQISPLAGVPPEVTDLDIALEAASGSVYLPLVVK